MKKLFKIEKFYFVMIAVLVVVAVVVTFVLRLVFFNLAKSTEVDEEFLNANSPRLDNDKLDSAYGIIYNKQIPDLDL